MKKVKKHYSVYYVGHGTGCYAKNYKQIYLGDVWAVSEQQACNCVRYRQRDKLHPNGGLSNDVLDDIYEEGSVVFEYKAYEI